MLLQILVYNILREKDSTEYSVSDPKIHWDPDVIAALDDDEFDYNADENALDDDFMLQANGIEPLADDECDEFE